MINKKKVFDLSTFLSLYIAQSIPMSFFSTVLPVIMRQENFSLVSIGLLQLIKLPWIFKFLWSPIVDRNCVTTGHFKLWIFSSELIYAALIFSVAFLDLKTDFLLILILIILSFIASATQDIATDALAVLSFNKKDKSLVNSMQSMGSFFGAMVGSGLLLLLFHRMGWNNLLPCLALFVFIALLPLSLNKNLQIQTPEVTVRAKKADFIYFFNQKGIWRQVGFLFLFYSGLIGTLAMLKPYMVDQGYKMEEIGLMYGVVGTSVGALSSFAAGFVVRRIGRHASRVLFASIIFGTAVFFTFITWMHPTAPVLFAGIFLIWASYGMSTIIVYTTAMDCVRPGREGTDFTVQTVVTHLSSMCIAILSGKLADLWGYQGLFCFQATMALISLIYVLTVFRGEQRID